MQKKRGWSCVLGIVLLGTLGICLIIGFFVVGINEYKTLPRLVSGFDFGTYNLDGHTYSAEQQSTASAWGEPQSFYILFYQREDGAGKVETVRYEEWTYSQQGVQIVYENGEEISRTEISPAVMVNTQYSPQQFLAFMNREQLAALTGLDEWFILPVEKELMQDAELYYTSGLMFGLQNGELIYVEAVPFEDQNAPAIELPPATPALALTPEETANQGTQVYDAVYFNDDIAGSIATPLEIAFSEGKCQLTMIEDAETITFTKIGSNLYQADDDNALTIFFGLYGFTLEENDEIFASFTYQE